MFAAARRLEQPWPTGGPLRLALEPGDPAEPKAGGSEETASTPRDERDDPRNSQQLDPKTGRSDDPRVDPTPR